MIPGFSADDLRALELFYPHAYKRPMDAIQQQIRFVHYSSAESAMKMLSNGEVWMRKASAMNDFREIDYGKECLIKAYKSEAGQRFKARLNEMFPGFTDTLEDRFNGWYPHFESSTYLTCISEHDPSEDLIGRLPDLVDRVIIGPTDFPWEIWEATIEILSARGVKDAAEKVIVSDIPLRH